MADLTSYFTTLAVVPVLVGPLQTLLALLPAILLALGSLIFAAFKPAGFKKLVKFGWRQKLFFGCVAAIALCAYHGFPLHYLHGRGRSITAVTGDATDWPAFHGGATRTGRGPGDLDPTSPTFVWTNRNDSMIDSSPAVSGNRILYSTISGIGPFSPQGRGAIVCVDAHSGAELWRYAPRDYRATFSSPVVQDGFVVCGEGLHLVQDARVTCLDLDGRLVWELRTKSHVEATACIDGGRVFIGAGDDGFYCVELVPSPLAAAGTTNVLWHLDGKDFPDCESSPMVARGVVYFGLGEGGHAVCAVDAASGKLLWKIETPFPVFAPPTIAGGKLYVAMGNGNFIQSAADLLEMKLQNLRDDGATETDLAAAQERLGPAGEVWCIDLATHAVDWKFTARDTILGAIACHGDSLYFGSRDGHLYHVSTTGQLLNHFRPHEPIVSSPALGDRHIYFTASSGRLYCLEAATFKTVWDVSLGTGEGFTSSPAVAHGHVFVGTPQDGLRCVGVPLPPAPPLWTQGELGGAADDEPVPEQLAVAWRFPADKDERFVVTAPLMPLDGFVYAAGRRADAHEFVKLDARSAAEIADRQVWSRRFDRPITAPPAGCGERLFVIESAAPDSSQLANLHCLSVHDGETLWTRPLAAGSSGGGRDTVWRAEGVSPPRSQEESGALQPPLANPYSYPGGIALDTRRVFLVTSRNALACLDAVSGNLLWQAARGDGVGAPAVSDNIVIGATADGLTAWDAPTGAEMWHVSLDKPPQGRPILAGHHIRLPFGASQGLYYLGDGGLVKSEPLPPSPPEHGAWRDVVMVGQPVTPFVTLKGRVYVANDAGEVLCLAAESP